jgi:hypothetical protein
MPLMAGARKICSKLSQATFSDSVSNGSEPQKKLKRNSNYENNRLKSLINK